MMRPQGEPKEWWFDPASVMEFDTERAEEYEARVVAFFDQYFWINNMPKIPK
ncbi:MAG: hypothetical protein IPJ46_18145 [Anaerolineales bacterium]|nr:hypothetical protein [Anaerolineales bacterium]